MPPDPTSPAGRLKAELQKGPLRTERLALRLPRASDAADVYGYATDVETIRWMGFRPHESMAESERVVSSWVAAWERGASGMIFVIEDAASGHFLGIVDLALGAHGGVIGYVLCRHAWGRGVATEAVRCIVDLAFEHFGLWRVWA